VLDVGRDRPQLASPVERRPAQAPQPGQVVPGPALDEAFHLAQQLVEVTLVGEPFQPVHESRPPPQTSGQG
jgi:hypothetical protein